MGSSIPSKDPFGFPTPSEAFFQDQPSTCSTPAACVITIIHLRTYSFCSLLTIWQRNCADGLLQRSLCHSNDFKPVKVLYVIMRCCNIVPRPDVFCSHFS